MSSNKLKNSKIIRKTQKLVTNNFNSHNNIDHESLTESNISANEKHIVDACEDL